MNSSTVTLTAVSQIWNRYQISKRVVYVYILFFFLISSVFDSSHSESVIKESDIGELSVSFLNCVAFDRAYNNIERHKSSISQSNKEQNKCVN